MHISSATTFALPFVQAKPQAISVNRDDQIKDDQQQDKSTSAISDEAKPQNAAEATSHDDNESAASTFSQPQSLSTEEKQEVVELSSRDKEVRAHEAAHLAAAGQYAKGGANYTYQRGPDDKRYATGGEVQIDTAPIAGDPKATIAKANAIRAAALSPANPSGQDLSVAASAAQMAAQANIDNQQTTQGPTQAGSTPVTDQANKEDENPPANNAPIDQVTPSQQKAINQYISVGLFADSTNNQPIHAVA